MWIEWISVDILEKTPTYPHFFIPKSLNFSKMAENRQNNCL
ncbi:hypothetical protein HMPREF9130_1112 [Peptoniphilus sp. oral taxon 375 str. F0436]|nr:hypothetical protein HMPREF9130_1112 [Peptoniphilus sp. oral taxon 375 str. F0436]